MRAAPYSRINDGLKHEYCWSVAVSIGDPDTILLTASKNAREAHMKASANSFVYGRRSGEPWREVRYGLSAPEGRRIAVATASAIEPDVFYLSAEGEIYRSVDRGVEWQRMMVEWANNSRPHHAVALAISEFD